MLKSIFGFFTKHRLIITVTIIALVTIFPIMCIWCGISVERTGRVFQIVEGVFVIAGVVIAVWQYYISTQAIIHSNEHAKIEKAIQLAQYYKDHIIKLSKPVTYVYGNTGIAKILNSIDTDKFNDFDKKECDKIFTKEQNKALKAAISDKEFVAAVMQAVKIFSLNGILDASIEGVDEENHIIKLNTNQVAISFMDLIVTEIMNDMEYFAMNFTHKLADETVVYSSLHQTYIEIMQLLYYQISQMNDSVEEKYYTNAIELYKTWKGQLNDKEEQLYKKLRIPELGTKARNIKDI